MSATEYSDYAKDRSGWFFGLSGMQLAMVVITGAAVAGRAEQPQLAAGHRLAADLGAGDRAGRRARARLVGIPVAVRSRDHTR